MDLKQIGAFVDVALNGSFARAAVTAGMAQSVLSRQVAALEREVGGRLLHRTGRGVALTELGERMLPRARALVADAVGFADAATNERERPSGEVTLGVVPVASRRLIAEIVRQVRQDHPAVRLRVLEAYSGQVEEMLASGRVDIAIYNRYRRGRIVNAEVIGRSEVHLIVRRDHVLAPRREIALRLLAGVPLAMPVRPNSLTSTLMGLAAAQKFNLDMCFESGSDDADQRGDPRIGSCDRFAATCLCRRACGRRPARGADRAAGAGADDMAVIDLSSAAVVGDAACRQADPAACSRAVT